MNLRIVTVGAALLGLVAGQAQAQYYEQPRPYEGRPYGYDDGYRRGPPPGSRCDAVLRTPYGPRQIVCPMGRPRPVGFECRCPPPSGYGPPARGEVIP